MKYKLSILLPIVICSCFNNIKEVNDFPKSHDETSIQDLYRDSDKLLNSTFKELVNTAPNLMKANLKKDQQAWLIQRGQTCNHDGSNHPKGFKSLVCFTEKNEQQVEVLIQRQIMLQDLLDSEFTGLSQRNTNNYTVDFQANCLCGNTMPYIDSQSERLVTNSSCLSSNNKSLNSEKIKNIKFDELGKLNVEALNEHGSTYQISFDPKGDHIYSIMLFGKWGVIKEKTISMVEAVGVGSKYSLKINDVCSDFDS